MVLDMSGQVSYMILGMDTSGLQVTYVIQVANEGVDVFDGTGAQVECTVRPGQRSCTQTHNWPLGLNGQWSCSVQWTMAMQCSMDSGHAVFIGHWSYSVQWTVVT